jgi:hypothetical protein
MEARHPGHVIDREVMRAVISRKADETTPLTVNREQVTRKMKELARINP